MVFKCNEATAAKRNLYAVMLDAADGVSPKTGLTVVATILKAGSESFAAISGTVAEIGTTGVYGVALAAGDLDTPGQAVICLTATGALTQYNVVTVLRWDMVLGWQ